MTLKIKGARTIKNEPVFIKTGDVPDNINQAFCDGKYYPAQKYRDGLIAIIDIERDREITISPECGSNGKGVEITETGKASLEINIGGKYFTSYVYDKKDFDRDNFYKPYLGPVMTSWGESFTRLDLTAKDHPHHRSVFLGVGEVNGADFWSNLGSQNPAGIKYFSGAAYGEITAQNIWTDLNNTPLVDEERTFTIYNQNEECRYVDIAIKFKAAYCNVEFGSTKEAGPLGIRLNEQLRVDRGSGHMINSYGAENESECWGRSASWCDYSGEISGHSCGIAVFDNESNERYPSAWHIRDYGLFAPNNLCFKGGFNIAKGESVIYRYRICFHEGGFNARDRFIQYANGKYC